MCSFQRASTPSNHIIALWEGQKRPCEVYFATWRPRAAFWAGITKINKLTRRAAPAPEARGGGGGVSLTKDQFVIAIPYTVIKPYGFDSLKPYGTGYRYSRLHVTHDLQCSCSKSRGVISNLESETPCSYSRVIITLARLCSLCALFTITSAA